MRIAESTTLILDRGPWGGRGPSPSELALVVAWSRAEPHRVGEILFAGHAAGGTHSFGRGCAPDTGGIGLVRQRPADNELTGTTRAPGISRHQWNLRRAGRTIEIENVGRRALRVDGVDCVAATVRAGAIVEIADELVLVATVRPSRMAPCPLPVELMPPFGEADAFGIVGESEVAWQLRRQLAFAAGRHDHILLTGPSGSGKELAARAIHGLSGRASEKLIARNAATFPEALVDAELFGNVRDYPNPGMAERPGLIGASDGGMLFLDEIGELPHALQAHLLRVLDGGDYQRLGESRSRRADVRVIAATNRAPDELKHDVLARLRLRVALPGLCERREDVPLLARHLLRRMAARDPMVAERCFERGDRDGEPRWTSRFVAGLLGARFRTHVRELETWLWQAILDSRDGVLDEPPALCASSHKDTLRADDDSEAGDVDPRTLDAAAVQRALDEHNGSRELAWRGLGLRSRHQLLRLMRRFGISAP